MLVKLGFVPCLLIPFLNSLFQIENKYFTQLKESTALQSRVEEDEEEIESLADKNRQMMKQVTTVMMMFVYDDGDVV